MRQMTLLAQSLLSIPNNIAIISSRQTHSLAIKQSKHFYQKTSSESFDIITPLTTTRMTTLLPASNLCQNNFSLTDTSWPDTNHFTYTKIRQLPSTDIYVITCQNAAKQSKLINFHHLIGLPVLNRFLEIGRSAPHSDGSVLYKQREMK